MKLTTISAALLSPTLFLSVIEASPVAPTKPGTKDAGHLKRLGRAALVAGMVGTGTQGHGASAFGLNGLPHPAVVQPPYTDLAAQPVIEQGVPAAASGTENKLAADPTASTSKMSNVGKDYIEKISRSSDPSESEAWDMDRFINGPPLMRISRLTDVVLALEVMSQVNALDEKIRKDYVGRVDKKRKELDEASDTFLRACADGDMDTVNDILADSNKLRNSMLYRGYSVALKNGQNDMAAMLQDKMKED